MRSSPGEPGNVALAVGLHFFDSVVVDLLIDCLLGVGCLFDLLSVGQTDNQWEWRHGIDNLLACLVPLNDKLIAEGNGVSRD